MKMNEIIDNLLAGNDLGHKSAKQVFQKILSRKIDDANIKQILVLLHKKIETADELLVLVQTVRRLTTLRLTCPRALKNKVADGCGTGGDGKRTFNISTLACIVAAGAGCYVAKHGNRAITSKCGSSDLMESFGIDLSASPFSVIRGLEKTHMAYFHAPNYSRAFQRIQPIRKELAAQSVRSIFNLTGPLLNPLRVRRQVIGVFHPRYLRAVAETLKRTGALKALVLSGEDGLDELSLSQKTHVIELNSRKIKNIEWKPSHFRFRSSSSRTLAGGTATQNHRLALRILNGKDRSARRNTVLLNAAALLYVCERAKNLRDGILKARASIETGAAMRVLRGLKEITHGA